jgi:3-methylcrotonyl-CoA carboxylase alpha subunit
VDYQFVLNGQVIAIKAERVGDRLNLSLSTENHVFDLVDLGNGEFLLRSDGMQRKVVAIKVSSKVIVLTDCITTTFDLPSSKDGDHFGADQGEHGDKSKVIAPMPGKVVKVLVEPGQTVEPKQKLLIVEAMKMENPLVAPFKAEVVKVNCTAGDLVDSDKILIELRQLT